MKIRFLMILSITVTWLVCPLYAAADMYKKGTTSITGSSTAYFSSISRENLDNELYSVQLIFSYFVSDRVDVGLGVFFENEKNSDKQTETYYACNQEVCIPLVLNNSYKRTTYGLGPTLTYHLPLTDDLGAYLGTGIFYFRDKTRYDYGDQVTVSGHQWLGRGGVEYFFNPSVALSLGIQYSKVKWDDHAYMTDKTELMIGAGVVVFLTRQSN